MPNKPPEPDQVFENWVPLRNVGDGRPYYFNVVTNESVWSKPDCVRLRHAEWKRAEHPVALRNVGRSGWFLVCTDHRNYFWYHPVKQLSTRHIPAEIRVLVRTIQDFERQFGPMRLGAVEKRPMDPASAASHGDDDDVAGDAGGVPGIGLGHITIATDGDHPNGDSIVADVEQSVDVMADQQESAIEFGEDDFANQLEAEEDDGGDLSHFDEQPIPHHSPPVLVEGVPIMTPGQGNLEPDETKGGDDDRLLDPSVQPPSEEELAQLFSMMLEEHQLSPFSVWEQEVARLSRDPRFHLISSAKTRRDLFTVFCQRLVDQKQQSTASSSSKQLETPHQLFHALLEETVTARMRFDEFSRKCRRDRRFLLLDSKERERRFKDFVKTRMDQKRQRRKALEDAFVEMLREDMSLHRQSTWAANREKYRDDIRYTRLESVVRKEDLFRDYVTHLRDSHALSKAEREKKALENLARESQSKANSTRRVMNHDLQKIQHEDALRVFDQILIDRCRSLKLTWQYAFKEAEKDSRFAQCERSMNKDEMRCHFEQHMKIMTSKCVAQFDQLMDQTIPSLTAVKMNFIQDIYPMVNTDLRVTQLLLRPDKLTKVDESYLEKHFQAYLQRRLAHLRTEFEQLLHEKDSILSYKFISFECQSREHGLEEEEDGNKLVASSSDAVPRVGEVAREEAVRLISEDGRYERMVIMKADRERMIDEWLVRVRQEYLRKKYTFDR